MCLGLIYCEPKIRPWAFEPESRLVPTLKEELGADLDGEGGPLVVDLRELDPLVVGVEVVPGGQEVVVLSGLVRLLPADHRRTWNMIRLKLRPEQSIMWAFLVMASLRRLLVAHGAPSACWWQHCCRIHHATFPM